MVEALVLEEVTAGYGDARVLDRLSFGLDAGRSLAVLGRNGVGKTTLLETLVGNTRIMAGRIRWQGQDITALAPHRRARAGLGWVPQAREVFASLTVEENLTVVARPARRAPWTVARVFGLFPRLAERRRLSAGHLSGGEQQMLAIGRALMTQPRLLLLDEPTEGLAPMIVAELAQAIRSLAGHDGLASIVVEQRPLLALGLTDQVIVLERGRVAHAGESAALLADRALLDRLLLPRSRPGHLDPGAATPASAART